MWQDGAGTGLWADFSLGNLVFQVGLGFGNGSPLFERKSGLDLAVHSEMICRK